MKELSRHDLQWILQRTPEDILAEMKSRPKRLFLAGGFIRACIAREEAADIDLFVPSKHEAHSVGLTLCGCASRKFIPGAHKSLHDTDNAYTVPRAVFGLPVQVIHRWVFDTPEQCVESFDFTVAKSAIWWNPEGDKWMGICHDDFYADLAAKRLIYTSPVRNEDPGGSLLRVLKFYQRGYRIPLGSLGAVMARMVSALKEEEIEAFMRIGEGTREQATAVALTKQLREVDPSLDPSHIAHLSDPMIPSVN